MEMENEKAKKTRVNFNLDENIHMRVKRLALENRTTATKLYSKWAIEGLEKEEKKQKKLDDDY